jgi:hypothetical protein
LLISCAKMKFFLGGIYRIDRSANATLRQT